MKNKNQCFLDLIRKAEVKLLRLAKKDRDFIYAYNINENFFEMFTPTEEKLLNLTKKEKHLIYVNNFLENDEKTAIIIAYNNIRTNQHHINVYFE
jgi:hypothetical protein